MEFQIKKKDWFNAACGESAFPKEKKTKDISNAADKSSWYEWRCLDVRLIESPYYRLEWRAWELYWKNSNWIFTENSRSSKPTKYWIFWKFSVWIHSSIKYP